MQMTRYAALLLTAVSFVSSGRRQAEAEKLAPYQAGIRGRRCIFGGSRRAKFYDLGSGDGRVVTLAAPFAADATGVGGPRPPRQSPTASAPWALNRRPHHSRRHHRQILATPTCSYLLPSSNDKIRPMLEKQLKKGTRVVSHDFQFAGWKPVKEEHIEDDGEGRSHTLYLYLIQ
jgi:hypothetical protein